MANLEDFRLFVMSVFWFLFTYLFRQKLIKQGFTNARAFVVASVAMAIPAAVASGILYAILDFFFARGLSVKSDVLVIPTLQPLWMSKPTFCQMQTNLQLIEQGQRLT
jgi:hypothetical protein